MTELLCKTCNITKPIYEFYKHYQKNGCFCKSCRSKYNKEYRTKNLDKIKKLNSEYYNKNSDKIKVYNQNYYIENSESIISNAVKYKNKQYKENSQFRTYSIVRSRLRNFLKASKQIKNSKTTELIGCNKKYLKDWIEYQFDSKMNWQNQGSYWHLDHTIPCDSFDSSNENDLKKCFNWTNLRPLEKSRNISKSSKIITKDILNQEIKVHYYLITKALNTTL
jgi:hypothetical protein